MTDARCLLCGRVCVLPQGATELPAHRYPGGLFRGRPCPSRYGVPLAQATPTTQVVPRA